MSPLLLEPHLVVYVTAIAKRHEPRMTEWVRANTRIESYSIRISNGYVFYTMHSHAPELADAIQNETAKYLPAVTSRSKPSDPRVKGWKLVSASCAPITDFLFSQAYLFASLDRIGDDTILMCFHKRVTDKNIRDLITAAIGNDHEYELTKIQVTNTLRKRLMRKCSDSYSTTYRCNSGFVSKKRTWAELTAPTPKATAEAIEDFSSEGDDE